MPPTGLGLMAVKQQKHLLSYLARSMLALLFTRASLTSRARLLGIPTRWKPPIAKMAVAGASTKMALFAK